MRIITSAVQLLLFTVVAACAAGSTEHVERRMPRAPDGAPSYEDETLATHCEQHCMRKVVVDYACGDAQPTQDNACAPCVHHYEARRKKLCSAEAEAYADKPAENQAGCGDFAFFEDSAKKLPGMLGSIGTLRGAVQAPSYPRGGVLQANEDGFTVQGQPLATSVGHKFRDYVNEPVSMCKSYDCVGKVVQALRQRQDACVVSMNVIQQWSPEVKESGDSTGKKRSEDEEEQMQERELQQEEEEEREWGGDGADDGMRETVCRELFHVEACGHVVGAECVRSPNDSDGKCSCHPIAWIFDHEQALPLDSLAQPMDSPPSSPEDAVIDPKPTLKAVGDGEKLEIDMNDAALKDAEASGDAKRVEKEMLRLTTEASEKLQEVERQKYHAAKKFYDSAEGRLRRRRQAHESCVLAMHEGNVQDLAKAFRQFRISA